MVINRERRSNRNKNVGKVTSCKKILMGAVNFVASLPKDSSYIATVKLSGLFSVNN